GGGGGGVGRGRSGADPEGLTWLAYTFANDVYPELMANDVNRVPWWLTWFSAFPVYTRRMGAMQRLGQNRLFWSIVMFLPIIGPPLGWLLYLLILANTQRLRRQQRWRKNLAALLSVRYGLGPGGLAALLEDDDAYSLLLQRFLADHQVPYRLPLYVQEGRYLFAAPEKIPVLAAALRRAIGRGRDN